MNKKTLLTVIFSIFLIMGCNNNDNNNPTSPVNPTPTPTPYAVTVTYTVTSTSLNYFHEYQDCSGTKHGFGSAIEYSYTYELSCMSNTPLYLKIEDGTDVTAEIKIDDIQVKYVTGSTVAIATWN